MQPPPVVVPAFSSFAAAAQSVLEHLHQRLGLELGLVARRDGADWVFLHRVDYAFGVEPGMSLPWADTVCSQMVQGHGPKIAPSAQVIPAYARQGVNGLLPIGTYVGIPLASADGELYGTLCALSAQESPADLVDDLALIELQGRLLSTLMDAEATIGRLRRARYRLHPGAEAGVLPLRLWEHLLEVEQAECRDLGTPAQLLRLRGSTSETGTLLLEGLTPDACVARTGEDELSVLVLSGADTAADQVRALLRGHVDGELTAVRRGPGETLTQADARLRTLAC